MARDNRDAFTTAYVECALWSSTCDPFGTCPQCGRPDLVLCRWNEDQEHVCAECSDTESNYEPPMDDNYDISSLAPETIATIESDCQSFQEANAAVLARWYTDAGETPERAGHDFWLTRNGHGAGFWDRWSGDTPQAEIGRLLSDAADAYGSTDPYVGDDGRIYLS